MKPLAVLASFILVFLGRSALPVEPASVHKKLYKKSMQRLYSRKK